MHAGWPNLLHAQFLTCSPLAAASMCVCVCVCSVHIININDNSIETWINKQCIHSTVLQSPESTPVCLRFVALWGTPPLPAGIHLSKPLIKGIKSLEHVEYVVWRLRWRCLYTGQHWSPQVNHITYYVGQFILVWWKVHTNTYTKPMALKWLKQPYPCLNRKRIVNRRKTKTSGRMNNNK